MNEKYNHLKVVCFNSKCLTGPAELVSQSIQNKYTGFQKKRVHFVFGNFPLPIMLNVHVFGTKIKIRTCTL